MEYLDRGLVAIKSNDGIFLSWRLLGTEPDAIAFNVYRDGELLNHSPITDSTNYVDANGTLEATYCVRAVLDGKEQAVSREVKAWPKEHFSIPVQQVPGDDNFSYFINDGECGDLDGDGEYEIVIKRISPDPDEHMLFEAYKLDGTMMWRINMGPNYLYDAELNFLVYDLDSDGKAEMVTRTSEGTTDGAGATIGDENRDGIGDYRPFSWKFISKGPDFLSVFDGMTGRELDRADYIERNPVIQYGDNYGHRATKCMFAAVYLDGEKPSLFITRGIYALIKLEAWNFRNGKLEKLWRFNSNEWPGYSYQGNHNMSTGDVDNDGYDEIIYASMTIDQDGKGLYTTELGHGDALHVSDMDPGRPGLEVWQCHETQASGITFRDAKTGLIIFEYDNPKDVGRCCAGDIDPTHRGFELWGSTGSPMYTCKGEEIGPSSLPMNFMVWWDGDLLRELLDHHWLGGEVGAGTGQIFKWDYEQKKADVILNAEGAYSCNWTKGTPTLQADLFGDWREEVVWRSADNRELRIYSTTIPTGHRIYTLMHDPHYRENVAWQNNSYNQPPHTGFYLGDGMDAPPKPNIEVVKP
ncbi:rhamnogalacturonan lyase [Candidatus Sumerlaeota bacterium]|nr:rhamnogalacturonan lyase [Candidatus Sumerlaeota bacterium]